MDRFQQRQMILIVDGHHDGREALCALLRAEGHLVSQAASGEKALALLGVFKAVGLILLAWQLPGASGAEVVAALRRHPELARIPVFALTTDDRECPSGVHGCVRKPFIQSQVLALARQYCGNPSGWDGATGGASA